MAGDWLKMRRDLQRHPKVVRMASALDADRFGVIGGLHAVWGVFDEHSEDGTLEGYTPKAMDDAIGWPGFSAAMLSVHWLSFQEHEGLAVPEFDEHNGQSAKRRATETKRKRLEREAEERAQEDRTPSASDADKKRPREEKNSSSKEEEKTARKRASPVARPDDVTEQTWDDWLQLRKTKRAPVSETVLSGARGEADKAGMPLERFLQIWCRRGSQGLEASWLRADERRPGVTGNKHTAAAAGIFGRPQQQPAGEVIDV